ncbi:MAG: type II toxin-antitoxin system HicA family toxin [Candidatus Omnitrophica bacterium]|nr:type II toxin-antitoxin system HicA family toxin [Candidatus Omnitrophota bacterium]
MPRITPIHYKKFAKFLKAVGCHLARQKGDHLVFKRADLRRPVIIPAEKNLPVFIIKNNLRLLNITPQQYLEILKDV